MAELVDLAHRLIENGRDNAAMAVPWRSGVALAKANAADEAVAFFVVGEFQPHSLGIMLATSEAEILLHTHIARAVTRSVSFLFHQPSFHWNHFTGDWSSQIDRGEDTAEQVAEKVEFASCFEGLGFSRAGKPFKFVIPSRSEPRLRHETCPERSRRNERGICSFRLLLATSEAFPPRQATHLFHKFTGRNTSRTSKHATPR